MPNVVPSQIVLFIDAALPYCIGSPTGVKLHPSVCGALNALLRLIDELPNQLLPSEPKAYAELIQNVESIRFEITRAQTQDAKQNTLMGPPTMQKPGQVKIVRDVLDACPDEIPPRHSTELPFINDPDFRKALLSDLGACRSALNHGEWKAATVLAGSLVESLLLWAVQQKSANVIQKACSSALSSGKLKKQPPADPVDWVLHQLVEVAEELALIESDTAKQTRLAKDFRNLIHPGRAIRIRQTCNRGTALAANAAVELASRDIHVRFP